MPATYPTLATAAGTTIAISTTAPAAHTVAGFDGIAAGSWRVIGAVVNSGGFPKAVREFDDIRLLDGSALVIAKGETMEAMEVEAVYQPGDTGQQAVAAASNGKTIVWFKWQLPSGAKVYCAGYVTGYGPSAETSDDYVGVSFTIKPIFDAAGAGVVISPAV